MSTRTPKPAAPAPDARTPHPWARPALRSSDPLIREPLSEGTKCAVAGLADTLESLPAMRERDRARAARDTLTGIGTCRRIAMLQARRAR